MKLVAVSLALLAGVGSSLVCEPGYTYWTDNREGNLVWVKKNEGGGSCTASCAVGLRGNSKYYTCDEGRSGFDNLNELQPVANGLGFNCGGGNTCWGNQSPVEGHMLVTKGNDPTKSCYYMGGDSFTCANNPGNANCFGERYSSICPCKVVALDGACHFDHPGHYPENPTFGQNGKASATDCLNRINYYRKLACDEGWRECPPSGLPPISECTCCHECANSESAYDAVYGAHQSFTRCGERSQGQGGGANCAAVIDGFVSERFAKKDSNGQYICDGHCGPIVAPGCWAFHWGKDPNSSFHTLNWRSCDCQKCESADTR